MRVSFNILNCIGPFFDGHIHTHSVPHAYINNITQHNRKSFSKSNLFIFFFFLAGKRKCYVRMSRPHHKHTHSTVATTKGRRTMHRFGYSLSHTSCVSCGVVHMCASSIQTIFVNIIFYLISKRTKQRELILQATHCSVVCQ